MHIASTHVPSYPPPAPIGFPPLDHGSPVVRFFVSPTHLATQAGASAPGYLELLHVREARVERKLAWGQASLWLVFLVLSLLGASSAFFVGGMFTFVIAGFVVTLVSHRR